MIYLTARLTMPRATHTKIERARSLRGDMTPEERIVWQHLRRNAHTGLHFRRQHVLRGFIVDFYCHAARLIIEIDGPVHDRQRDADTERDAILSADGLRILRITNHEVNTDISGVLTRIHNTCLQP